MYCRFFPIDSIINDSSLARLTLHPQRLLKASSCSIHFFIWNSLWNEKYPSCCLSCECTVWCEKTHHIMNFWREDYFFIEFVPNIKNNGMPIPFWSLQALPQNRKCFNKTKVTEMRGWNLLTCNILVLDNMIWHIFCLL